MSFTISNDRLKIGRKYCDFVPANSSGGRMVPTVIILHDTADRPRPKDTVNWFSSKQCRVSAHFVVERDGSVTQMVDCDKKAWHAGKSSFKRRYGVNSFGVGIEIDNPGKLDSNGHAWYNKRSDPPLTGIKKASSPAHGSGYWLPYTDEQVETVIEICKALIAAYPSIKDISTHYEISPGRKIDVNPLFPVEDVKAAAFGKPIKAKPKTKPPMQLGDDGEEVKAVQARLKALGYTVGDADGVYGAQTRAAVLAFQIENGLKTTGSLNSDDIKLLQSDDAKAMPKAEREEITVKEVKAKGNKVVWWTVLCKRVLKFFGIPTVGLFVADDGSGVDTALNGLETARHTISRGNDILWWLITPKGLFLIAALGMGFGIYWILTRMEKDQVGKVKAGTDLS